MPEQQKTGSWLNRTVLGVGLTSLFSDWSHETATAVLPAFLAVIGAGPAWLGAIEGISDGLSRFANLLESLPCVGELCAGRPRLWSRDEQVRPRANERAAASLT